MKKIGILGGGQLGRMLLQAAANYDVETYILENNDEAPASHLCHHFVKGSIVDYNDVYNFGKNLDAITVEIENVNNDALEKLELEGKIIVPKTSVLKIITNKILQKQFYKSHEIPTAEFKITNSIEDIDANFLPAVQKIAMGGYDGKGVVILNNENDLLNAFTDASVLEKKLKIKHEIAQTIAIAQNGSMAMYPPVEMVFDNDLNLLDFQICPANIDEKILWKLEAISHTVAKNLKSAGLFTIEFIVNENDEVFVNETAPRVHNSGHHTIEAHYCSQFDMLWRIMLNYPLGNTNMISPSLMFNIIGAENYNGTPLYEGLEEVLKIENAFIHLYGKKQTKPGRKMGHITVLSKEKQELLHQANRIKNTLKVIS